MPVLADIQDLPSGARFYRADLHVHSFGGSHDVADTSMTPERIVNTAIHEGLDLLAVADHNEISNVNAALTAATGTALLVVPAMEVSTPEGHLLCYLPTLDALEKFFGRLSIVDRGTADSRCQTSMHECLNHLELLSGFGIMAHVDAPGGFAQNTTGASPHKADVLAHKSLLGVELRAATSPISYSAADPDQHRAQLGEERIKRLALGGGQYLARVLNSDSHSLAALGRNAQGDRKVTRVKMDRPSFSSLRIALEDADARIRIEDQVPLMVPRVVGVHFDGGFLDGQQIHFSPNLNCIIGGRGTGKSTTFEAIRCLQGTPSENSLVDSEVWPAQLTIFWQDQAGQVHGLSRSHGGDVSNLDDSSQGPVAFPIESYGQGETARISKQSNENPIALLSYLDRFVDIEEARTQENAARDHLLELQAEIEKAQKNVDAIPQCERALATTQQQLTALEQAKAKDVIELQRQLETERALRAQVTRKLGEIQSALGALALKQIVADLAALASPVDLTVGRDEFQAIVTSSQSFEAEASAAHDQVTTNFDRLRASAESHLSRWKAKESDALKEIDAKRRDLEAQNIRLDMAYIQKLAKDEARLKTELINLKTWKPHLDQLKGKRTSASKSRWVARERIAMSREVYAKAASDTLKAALRDLFVRLKFERSAYSPDAEQQVIQAMGWRTIQVPRAALLLQRLTVPGLLAALDKRDAKAIMSVTTAEGAKVFDKAEADRIVETLGEPAMRFALERCEVHDLPRLTVTKTVPGPAGKPQYLTRDFARLSLGQQQSVLLALMLSSHSNAPLIIDQPEDNLDGEFIYHSLVPVLRLAKERRQVIVVTHNANIAVLGDAEQIVVLKSTSDRATIGTRGSIDDPVTQDAACCILEGAKEAFARRARIYGGR